MMDVFEVMDSRRSVRSYTDEPVSHEALLKVMEAARNAPSWKNWQCWRYMVISDKQKRMELGYAMGFNPSRDSYENAPYTIVLCADEKASGDLHGKQYYMLDAGISFEHMVLAAHALGLGTCWVGWFNEDAVREILGVPEGYRIVATTPLGVPAKQPNARPRKPLSEIVFSESWGREFVL